MSPRCTCCGILLLVLWTAPALAWQNPPPPPQIQYLEGLNKRPYSVAITPDGKTVLAGSIDGQIGVWDRQTGEPVRLFQATTGPLLSLEVSRSSLIYAATTTRGPVQLFDLPRRHPLGELTGLSADPTCVAVSAQGKLAVIGESGNGVRLIDLAKSTLLRSLSGPTAPITGVAIAVTPPPPPKPATKPDGKKDEKAVAPLPPPDVILSVSSDGAIRGWLPADGASQGVVLTSPLTAVAIAPGAKPGDETRTIAVAAADGLVRLLSWPPQPRLQLVQHGANVPAVAITSDGRLILSTSENQQVQLFDGATGKPTRALVGQQGTTTAADLHHDGTLAVTGNSTGSWQAWETAKGTLRPGRGGHAGSITAIAVAPGDLLRLATAGTDGTVRTWRLVEAPVTLKGHSQTLTSITLSRDGKTLVTGSADKTLRTWTTADARPATTLKPGPDSITAVATNTDGTLLARGDSTGRILLTVGNAPPTTLLAHSGPISGIAILKDAKSLLTSGADGHVRMWTPSKSPRVSFPQHAGPLQVIAATTDGKIVATGTSGGTLRLISTETGKPTRLLEGLAGPTTSASWSGNGSRLVAGNGKGQVAIWDTNNGKLLGIHGTHGSAVTGVALHPDGKRLLTAGADGTWKIWTLPLPLPTAGGDKKSQKKPEPIKPLVMVTAHSGGVHSLAISADGNQVLTGGADKTARLYAIGGQLVRTLTGHTGPVRAVGFTSTHTVAAGDDKTVRAWARNNGAVGPVLTLPAAVVSLSANSKTQRIAAGLSDGSLQVIDLAAGAPLERMAVHKGPVRAVAWSSDGYVITGGDDKTMVATAINATAVHVADPASVTSLAVLPDGSGYFTGGSDRRLKRWTADGKPVKSFATLGAAIRHIAITPDGKTVVAGGDPLSANKEIRAFQVADGKQLFAVSLVAGVTALTTSGNDRVAVADSAKTLTWLDAITGAVLETAVLPAVATDLVAAAGGRRLFLAGADNNAWQIDASLEHRLAGHKGGATGVAWTSNGQWLLSSGADNTARQWDTATGKPTRMYTGSNRPLQALAASHDGKRLVASTNDSRVLGWPLAADGGLGAVASDLALTSKSPITDVAINGDGSVVVTAASDNVISTWHTSTGKLLERLPGHRSTIRSIAISADASRIVSGANDRVVSRFQPAITTAFPAHSSAMRALAFTPDGGQLVSAGDDRRIARWMVPGGQPVNEYAGSTAAVRALAVSGDGRLVVAGGDDKIARTWSLQEGQPIAQVTLPGAVTGVAIDHAGTTLSVTSDMVVRSYDVTIADGKPVLVEHQQGHGHTKNATAVAMAANGRQLVTVSLDRTLKRWHAAAGPARSKLAGHTGPIYASAFNADDSLLATAGGDHTVRLWNLATGKPTRQLQGHTRQVTSVAFNNTTKQVLSTSLDGTMRAWPLQDDAEVQVFQEGIKGGLFDLAVVANGSSISLVGRDRMWTVLAGDTLKPKRHLPGHASPIYAVAYNGTGSRAATLDRSGKLFVWNTSNGAIPFHQQLPVTRATALAFAPDGADVFVAGNDKRLVRITIPAGAR